MADQYTIQTTIIKEEPEEETNQSFQTSGLDNQQNSNILNFQTTVTVKHIKEENDSESDIFNILEDQVDSKVDLQINLKDELEIGPETLLMPFYNQQSSQINTDHIPNVKFICDNCKTTFKSKPAIKKHMKSCQKYNRCRKCGKIIFSSKKYSSNRQSKCIVCKTYKCKYCRKLFPGLVKLKRHMHVHNSEKPYECDICFKTFVDKSYMIDHYNVHLDKRPHACTKCNKRFNLKSSLLQHSKDHDMEFKCDVCSKKFSRKYNLTIHLLTHTTPKYIMCFNCRKGYVDENLFYNHHSSCVKSKSTFICTVCNMQYRSRNTLMKHLNSHVNEDTKVDTE